MAIIPPPSLQGVGIPFISLLCIERYFVQSYAHKKYLRNKLMQTHLKNRINKE